MACFADLPLELIEAIAHWIDDRLDVLAFALTSPSIGALLSPRHTQLRVIRCTKRTLCVWRFLASNNALSRNVRVLEIDSISAECAPDEFCTPLAECPHCFPNPVWTAEHRTAARKVERATLARALRNLVNLTKFTHRNTTVHGNEGREMWKAVAMCPNIETLSIAGNGHQYIWKCAAMNMSNLTHFEYWSSYAWPGEPFDPTRLGTMLRERCPKLQLLSICVGQSLSIACPAADISEPILSGRWPDLWHLRLSSAACTATAFVAFLQAHPKIRTLSIDANVGCDVTSPVLPRVQLPCPEGLLPNLEVLMSTCGQIVDILSAPCAQPRPLQRIATNCIYCITGQHSLALALMRTLSGVQLYTRDWSLAEAL